MPPVNRAAAITATIVHSRPLFLSVLISPISFSKNRIGISAAGGRQRQLSSVLRLQKLQILHYVLTSQHPHDAFVFNHW